jgi:hypothetical protein
VQATTTQLEQGYFESARGGDYVLVIARQNHRLRSARRNSIDARCNALSVRSGVGHGSRARARMVGLSSSQLNRPRRRRTASLCEPPRRRAWIRVHASYSVNRLETTGAFHRLSGGHRSSASNCANATDVSTYIIEQTGRDLALRVWFRAEPPDFEVLYRRDRAAAASNSQRAPILRPPRHRRRVPALEPGVSVRRRRDRDR